MSKQIISHTLDIDNKIHANDEHHTSGKQFSITHNIKNNKFSS